MNKEIKTIDLGWAVARLTKQEGYPKMKLELFTPSTETHYAQNIDIVDNYVMELIVGLRMLFEENKP